MKFDDSQLMWAMNTLSANQHPDPIGLVAQMESTNDLNAAGVDPEMAAEYGVPHVNEPVMSMYAAMRRDIDTQDVSRYSTLANRSDVEARTDAVLMKQVRPVNPFMDRQGRMTLQRGRAPAGKAGDLKQLVLDILDDYT